MPTLDDDDDDDDDREHQAEDHPFLPSSRSDDTESDLGGLLDDEEVAALTGCGLSSRIRLSLMPLKSGRYNDDMDVLRPSF